MHRNSLSLRAALVGRGRCGGGGFARRRDVFAVLRPAGLVGQRGQPEENAPTLVVVGVDKRECGEGYYFTANVPRSVFTNRAPLPFVLISLSKAEYSVRSGVAPAGLVQ